MQRRHWLAGYVTGAYPGPKTRLLLSAVSAHSRGRIERLLDRREGIDASVTHAQWLPELLGQFASLARQRDFLRVADRLEDAALRAFGRAAQRDVRRPTAAIYHYRSGFGHESVAEARRSGMVALCDHSMAHPCLFESLVEGRGKFGTPRMPSSRLLRAVLRDIEAADAVVVNSEFARQTFLRCGYAESRLHVVCLGVDERFLGAVPSLPSSTFSADATIRLGFAGAFTEAKGAAVLVDALRRCDRPWRLDIAGPMPAAAAKRHRSFLRDTRVVYRGILTRSDLARWFLGIDAFVFPTFAEGSARVVFEALASGRFVITTPNAGSIVEHGIHGALVPPGSSSALAEAVSQASADIGRVISIGAANAVVIRNHFRQQHYGDRLARLYEQLIEARFKPISRPPVDQ
jgi:glycosyltransferase involved in cell wall biosynthesis